MPKKIQPYILRILQTFGDFFGRHIVGIALSLFLLIIFYPSYTAQESQNSTSDQAADAALRGSMNPDPTPGTGTGTGSGGGTGTGSGGGTGTGSGGGTGTGSGGGTGTGSGGGTGTGSGGGTGTGSGSACLPEVDATFESDCLSVTAVSTKDLSNVVLKFCDGTTQKFDNLSGYSGTFSGTGSHAGKTICGIWIKSGCNQSGDGPGYGEFVDNPDDCPGGGGGSGTGTGTGSGVGTGTGSGGGTGTGSGGGTGTGSGSACLPEVDATFESDCLSVTAVSTKDLSNVVLKFCDGTTQKFDNLSGYSGMFSGTGSHAGKTICGIWIKSGCNQSGDGPGYGEFVGNPDDCPGGGGGSGTGTGTGSGGGTGTGSGVGTGTGSGGGAGTGTGSGTGSGAANDCPATVDAEFSANCETAEVTTTGDLVRVKLQFDDNTTQWFYSLSGDTGAFSGTGSNQGKNISKIWVQSSCGEGSSRQEHIFDFTNNNSCDGGDPGTGSGGGTGTGSGGGTGTGSGGGTGTGAGTGSGTAAGSGTGSGDDWTGGNSCGTQNKTVSGDAVTFTFCCNSVRFQVNNGAAWDIAVVKIWYHQGGHSGKVNIAGLATKDYIFDAPSGKTIMKAKLWKNHYTHSGQVSSNAPNCP